MARPHVAIDDREAVKVEEFAHEAGLKKDHAYAELIRIGLEMVSEHDREVERGTVRIVTKNDREPAES